MDNRTYEYIKEKLDETEEKELIELIKRMQKVDVTKLEDRTSIGWAHLHSNVFCDVIQTAKRLIQLDYAERIFDCAEDYVDDLNTFIDQLANGVYDP